MNILFITASRIGDAVLSTGLLAHIEQTWPDAKVTIACGPLAESLFEGYPLLTEIIVMKKEKRHGHWRRMLAQVSGQRWDMVVDLRNSVASRLVRARQRYVFGGHIRKEQHKAEQNAAVMQLDYVPDPRLWFTVEQEKFAQLIPAGEKVLAVAPTANWRAKTWPAERFIEIVQWMDYPRVAVFAAPGEEDDAYKVLESVPAGHGIDVIAKGSPGDAAASLARCDFFIGNDSGLMHCAAAAGIQTLGLFGPSYPQIYRPWGLNSNYVSTPESFDELTDYPDYHPDTAPCLMESLSVEAVKEKIKDMKKFDI